MNRADGETDRRRRFGSLCESLRPDLLRFAWWLGRDRGLAEDVVQEALLRAWKSYDSLADEGKAKAWLLTIVRREFRGKALLTALRDLPLGVSHGVVGLALILVYGRRGELGGWLAKHGISVIFALPGMVLATIFVCIPFVAREVIPVLREIGTEQEQEARTLGASSWQIF